MIDVLKRILFFCGVLLCTAAAFGQQLPAKPSTLVTDYTNTLADGDKQHLENKLDAFDDSTSTQIAVLIIRSVGEYDIDEYAQKVGRSWGIGQKEKNNGILILVALGDRKVSIQTGYGVEGAVPDAITNQIIQNDIKPRFRAGDYYGGLNAATDDLIRYTRGEYKGEPQSRKRGGGSPLVVIIIVIVVLILVFRGRGGGGQIIGSRGGASPFWWFLAGNMLGRSSGGWGGSSGGGDSGGGFGGFGGGDFGGGGSSGSW